MCGILALLNKLKALHISKSDIDNSIKNGISRGPEAYEFYKNNDETLEFHFHRLAINGLNTTSMQPIVINGIILICNGEIYNYKSLYQLLGVKPKTKSDCEIIIHLYQKYGIETTLNILDGVFSFILYDINQNSVYCARDIHGVRPLYYMSSIDNNNYVYAFASEIKVLYPLFNLENYTIRQFLPGHYMHFKYDEDDLFYMKNYKSYYKLPDTITQNTCTPSCIINYSLKLFKSLENAVIKRVKDTTDRPIACLLSGGLDSSIITALVNKYYGKKLETYSIGMKGSQDLKYAKQVASYLKTNHHEVILEKEEFLQAIPEVIKITETYDTTTIRASVGNYLIGKYIKENSEAKVIFNGDGSDELTGGYIYMLLAPDDIEFDKECRRLLKDIHNYDVLRSDKSISSNGLEPRTPFLDKQFVEDYIKIPSCIRNPRTKNNDVINSWKQVIGSQYNKNNYITEMASNMPEKLLLRYAISKFGFNNELQSILPDNIVWRSKEAFSDGVSGTNESWYEIIQLDLHKNYMMFEETFPINKLPKTKEQMYYYDIFNQTYYGVDNILQYYWMPKYTNATDASARTLEHYKNNS